MTYPTGMTAMLGRATTQIPYDVEISLPYGMRDYNEFGGTNFYIPLDDPRMIRDVKALDQNRDHVLDNKDFDGDREQTYSAMADVFVAEQMDQLNRLRADMRTALARCEKRWPALDRSMCFSNADLEQRARILEQGIAIERAGILEFLKLTESLHAFDRVTSEAANAKDSEEERWSIDLNVPSAFCSWVTKTDGRTGPLHPTSVVPLYTKLRDALRQFADAPLPAELDAFVQANVNSFVASGVWYAQYDNIKCQTADKISHTFAVPDNLQTVLGRLKDDSGTLSYSSAVAQISKTDYKD